MRFAYADPPYLGCSVRLYGHLHPDAAVYDTEEGHRALIERLIADFPDGWALSCQTKDLRIFLPWCPEKARVLAWCKPFAFFSSPSCNIQYAWEPVILYGGRMSAHPSDKSRDWLSCNPLGITQQQRDRLGTKGAKPEAFCHWLFGLLGADPDDELVDLFPGSGAVTRAWASWRQLRNVWSKRRDDAPEPPLLFRDIT